MTTAFSRRSNSTFSLLAVAGAIAGAGLYAWKQYKIRVHGNLRAPAAAFADEGAHPDSFVQTRDAGPEHIRDGGDWDTQDQASDESFPSSDPPAANNFKTPEPIDYAKT
jgi:hypothetical protein